MFHLQDQLLRFHDQQMLVGSSRQNYKKLSLFQLVLHTEKNVEILMQQVYHLFSIPQFILKNLKRSFNRFKINDFKVALTTLKENLSCIQHDL